MWYTDIFGLRCTTLMHYSHPVLLLYVVVLFRVIAVYPDLKPFMQEINVSVSVSVLFIFSQLSSVQFYSQVNLWLHNLLKHHIIFIAIMLCNVPISIMNL